MLQLSADKIRNPQDVECDWQALSRRASSSFFLSWTWICTWIEHQASDLVAVRASAGGALVALGLLSLRRVRRRGIFAVNVLALHETSARGLDALATEYNGFLIAQDAPVGLPAELIAALIEWRSRDAFAIEWDEISLPGVTAIWASAAMENRLAPVVRRSEPAIGIVLEGVGSKDDILSRLSRNARAQLRRSFRAFAADCPLHLTPARTADEAKEFLHRLAELGAARWAAAGRATALSQPSFLAFHRSLIDRGWQRGEVELLEFRAGARVVGYLYNFLWSGVAHNYGAGFAPSTDPHVKHGIMAHLVSAERYARQGYRLYDLMAGEARYKRSLGVEHQMLHWVDLQRPTVMLRVESALVAMRRHLVQLAARRRPS